MKVLKIPLQLRAASLTLLFSVILIAIEVVIADHAPWWKLPLPLIFYWSGGCFLISASLCLWIVTGKKWSYFLVCVFFVSWILLSLMIAIRTGNPTLGFYTLFIMIFAMFELILLRVELRKVFFYPGVRWYQSFPKPIPGLCCLIQRGDRVQEFKVSKIDSEGAFVYISKSEKLPREFNFLLNRVNSSLEIVFKFRTKEIKCNGQPISIIEYGKGVGLQFTHLNLDTYKEICDFVSVLSAEGYA